MSKGSIYLDFVGQTEEVMGFYQSIFGGEFRDINRYSEMPDSENMPEADRQLIMHMALQISENLVLHASDSIESMGKKLVVGNNFYIMIETESKEEADRFFSKLSSGGQVEMPIEDVFWGAYFGSLVDKYGVQWMINFEKSQ
jgi:PhnB protein